MGIKPEIFNWQSLRGPVVGVDEVGRGCLAGPVYASAVILNLNNEFKHYTDSKALSETRREKYSEQILREHYAGIGFATIEEITRMNILWASLLAMKRAVDKLVKTSGITPGVVIVDGNKKIPKIAFDQITLIKGDLRAHPVAAASIVAKVTRDQLLKKMATDFPGYGFEKHKGYSTKFHKEAIKKWGPTSIHRPTFAGVKEFLKVKS